MKARETIRGHRGPDVERWVQMSIMLAIGTAAGAASFRHVHDVAVAHGQAGWLAWADSVVLELMSVASGLEMRRRKRLHRSVWFPAAVMGISVVLSLGAQVVEAESSPIGWIAAAIPAFGFLIMVKIALSSSGSATDAEVTVAGITPGLSESSPPASEEGDGGIDPDIRMLLPAARAAALVLGTQGRRVTAKSLGDVLRADGYGISQVRASALLEALRPEPVARAMRTTAAVEENHGQSRLKVASR